MFTTWSDLEQKMKNDLANNKWHVASYTIRNRTTTYQTFTEFKKALDYVSSQAALERGEVSKRTIVRGCR
jgi:hypothetical protein